MMHQSSRLSSTRKVDPITLKEDLIRVFPHYTVTYAVMTDAYKIRSARFSHKLEYNTHKLSKFESEGLEARRFALLFNLGVIALGLLVVFLDRRLSWRLISGVVSVDSFIFGLVLFMGLVQYLVPMLKPRWKRELEEEHLKVRHRLEELLR